MNHQHPIAAHDELEDISTESSSIIYKLKIGTSCETTSNHSESGKFSNADSNCFDGKSADQGASLIDR
jgi:hypothetical protein